MLASSTRFNRLIAGAAMIAASVVIVVAETLHPRFEMDAAKQLATVASDTGRWYAAHALVLVALALLVPAFMGLAHILEATRPTLGHLGLIAFVPGLVALAALVGMELVLWQMAQQVADRAEMIALAERLDESAGIAALFVLVLLYPVAWLLVGTGLYLARSVPRWTAILIALSQPVGFVGELSGGPKWLAVAAQVAFAAGLIPIGVRILRQSDEAWEQPPALGEVRSAAA